MILYNRVNMTEQIRFISAVYEGFSSGSADLLRLSIADPDGAWIRTPPEPGDIISMDDHGIDTGEMYVHSSRRIGRETHLLATAMPTDMKDPRTESWQQVRLDEIIRKKAERHGLYAITDGIPNQFYPFMQQRDESDAAFLQRILTAESCCLRVHDGYLIAQYEPSFESEISTNAPTYDDKDVIAISDRRPQMYARCTVTCGSVTGTFKDALVSTDRVLEVDGASLITADQSTAARYARGYLRAANKWALSGTALLTELTPSIVPGSVVHINMPGSSQWSGLALVEVVRHDFYRLQTRAKWRRLILEGY